MPHNSTRGSIDPVDRTGLEQCRPRMRGWAQTEAARAWPSGEWNDHIRASSARQIQTSSVSRLGPQPYEMAMVTPEGQCLWSLWLVDRGVPYRGMGSQLPVSPSSCFDWPCRAHFKLQSRFEPVRGPWGPCVLPFPPLRALRLALPLLRAWLSGTLHSPGALSGLLLHRLRATLAASRPESGEGTF